MRTKTLLLAAAISVAGLASSQADTVYSQNIVGYVNQPLALGFNNLANPLDKSGGNALTNVIQNADGHLDGALVYVWNGAGFTTYTLDSTLPTGVGDAADVNAVPSPTLNPGTTFFLNNNTGVTFTNTVVGTVNIVTIPGTGTNTLPAGLSFVASKIPFGGGVTSSLQFTNVAGQLDGSQLYVPNIVGGAVNGYITITFDSSLPSGFGDAADVNAVPEPQIPIGSGFFYNNNLGFTVQWIQNLN